MSQIGPGYVHVYTGEGKGKTTAALGLALRAVGAGCKVLVIQFLKGEGHMTGERAAARRLAPDLQIRPRGPEGFLDPKNVPAAERQRAANALVEARQEMAAGRWDVIILDEVNTAIHMGLVPVEDVLAMIAKKPSGAELILTGRSAPKAVIDKADLVTEMREVKHYFRKGVAARKGIES